MSEFITYCLLRNFQLQFFFISLLLNLRLIYPSARKEQLTIFKGYDILKERRFVNSKSVRKSQCDRCFSVNERTAGKEIISADCISSLNNIPPHFCLELSVNDHSLV